MHQLQLLVLNHKVTSYQTVYSLLDYITLFITLQVMQDI